MEIVNAHITEIISFISGGTIGSLLTLRITRNNSASGKGKIVDQGRAKAGGDIVGGDKIAK